MRTFGVFFGAAVVMLAGLSPSAQLLNKQAPIVVSHYHLNVTSVDAHKKFWVDTLGGKAEKFGSEDVVRFPSVLLFLTVQKPTGPTRGTVFDHIGFAVPDVPETTKKVVAAGYQLTVGRELPGQAPPATGPSAVYGRFSYLVGPDGVKVELVTNMEPNAPPIVHHHVHYTNPQYVEMQEWQMKLFDATQRPGANGRTDFFTGADLPGVGYMLNFFKWEMPDKLTGTAGRAVDHVGFEVRGGLEAFVKKLDAKGIKPTTPYRRNPALNNLGTATFTDPWGMVIELTEGLDQAF